MRWHHFALLIVLATILLEAEGRNRNIRTRKSVARKPGRWGSVKKSASWHRGKSSKLGGKFQNILGLLEGSAQHEHNLKLEGEGQANASTYTKIVAQTPIRRNNGKMKLKPKIETISHSNSSIIGKGTADAFACGHAELKKNGKKSKRNENDHGKRKEKGSKKRKGQLNKERIRQCPSKKKRPRAGRKSASWRKKRSRGKRMRRGERLERCQDIELYSTDNEYNSELVPDCKRIKSVTLNWAERECDCVLGETYGFDKKRLYVDYGCGGSFRVCCRPVKKNKAMRKSLKCRRPFHEEDGRCITTENSNCMYN
ncbi:hypothetical protein PoB_006783300 [Plakobranchus ocellatus]|uniref:Uncharacterized protein n=1 Tax=Plakobranchus ocellatus TaxID=259542 RepID=A0AAV4DAV0_9GAST|nr:hypothetical protein PoB_006783300 [Plakobranchus ocellatus]